MLLARKHISCQGQFYSQLSLPTMNWPALFSQPHSLVLGSRMQPVPTPELVPSPLQKKVQQSASEVKDVGTAQVYAEHVPYGALDLISNTALSAFSS